MFHFVDLNYQYIVDQQPIGNRLFRQFCEATHLAQHSLAFYDRVVSQFDNYDGCSRVLLVAKALNLANKISKKIV